jgi:mannose-6-phosphate isomerase-like protein (cupin superfamily)
MQIVRGNEIPFTPASHEDRNDPGVLKQVLATRDDLRVGHVQMVNWSRLPVGKSFRRHYHEDMQEIFVIVEGQARMLVDENAVELKRGDAILVDPREEHSMTNTGADDVHYVVFGISSEEGGRTVVCED